MAAATNVPALSVVYRPQPAAHLRSSIHPLLELTLAQTNSQGAYLYRLDRDAWSDWRLERFPEFLRNRFQAAASVPLLEGGEAVGVVNICRLTAAAYQPREAAFLRSLSLPLGARLAHSMARVKLESEVEALSRKLADRKLLDRAKGLLQASNQWTEEEAYLHLRRTSRQRRTPMRDVAREIIDLAESVQ
jgi:GAF domain-containing protein